MEAAHDDHAGALSSKSESDYYGELHAQGNRGCLRGRGYRMDRRVAAQDWTRRHGCRIIQDAGLRVSSLCRGGFFPAATAGERRLRVEDNLHAIDEAAAIGTDLIVLVCGPAPDRDLDAARAIVVEGISHIVDHARQCGVRLGIEPLHPMYAAERSVIVTLNQANQIAEQFDTATVGVVVDAYHVWWDPQVYVEIARAGRRIFAFHVI